MDLKNLNKILEDEPQYRKKQAKDFLFKKLVESWDEATALPLKLRKELEGRCPLQVKARIFPSKEANAIRALIELSDGLKIESVLMRHIDGRNTVCVSSQVGCSLNCDFCATGKMGFKRNLSAMEIIEQVLFFVRYLKKEGRKVNNIVFMGMGEPFLNYENVLEAIRILNDKDGLNIGTRHISISTIGIIEGIRKFANENLQVNLAISLHAPNNVLRSKIIPINKKYPIEEILKAVDEYIKKTRRKVMFEYLLIKDLNDSNACAKELAELVKKPLYFLNLILYNQTGVFEPPPFPRIKRFRQILEKAGVNFSQRYRFGQEIKAACGQLAAD